LREGKQGLLVILLKRSNIATANAAGAVIN
jgi:hypothetical protein